MGGGTLRTTFKAPVHWLATVELRQMKRFLGTLVFSFEVCMRGRGAGGWKFLDYYT